MDSHNLSTEVKLQLLKVVGGTLDHCYALVNVEQEVEEWLAHLRVGW